MGVSAAVIDLEIVIEKSKVFKHSDIETVCFTKMFDLRKDESCIQRMDKKSNEETEIRRKRLKAIRGNYIDKNKQQEGIFYEVGAF